MVATKAGAVTQRQALPLKAPATAVRGQARKRAKALPRSRSQFAVLYRAEAFDRVKLVKAGLPASLLEHLSAEMAIPRSKLYAMMGLPRATVERKVNQEGLLNKDESEHVLGFARLVGQVETIVRESGNPEGFDAAKWTAAWLDRSHAALGGKRPAELMDTADGRGIVSDLVARMQSGAYT